jgi:hypothetical protein
MTQSVDKSVDDNSDGEPDSYWFLLQNPSLRVEMCVVAGEGFEPSTSGLWSPEVTRRNLCLIPCPVCPKFVPQSEIT